MRFFFFFFLEFRIVGWRAKRNQHRHVEADKIRESAKEETLRVERSAKLWLETAASAAPPRPKPTSRRPKPPVVRQQAAAHRSEATTSRDQLNEQLDRADTMDPASQTPETPRTADRKEHQDH